jgi:DNA polymerase III epsilon subunit-like protein
MYKGDGPVTELFSGNLMPITCIMKKTTQRRADTAIVLDFETTGLSADNGDRAIENWCHPH